MRKIIHHLRRQPEEVRRHVLHLATGIFAFILLALWVYSLGVGWHQEDTEATNADTFSGLKANIIDGYNQDDPLSDF